MQKQPKVGVVGYGIVGKAMTDLFGSVAVYDPVLSATDKNSINECDVVLICVPTPMNKDGSCDISIVEESVAWIKAPLIIIRSTVAPGTTDKLCKKYKKEIVFQPEYLGETPAHLFGNVAERTFIVLGGTDGAVNKAADFYKHYYNSMVRFYFSDAITAEICKYMENAFYAMKVTFINEFYDIAEAHNVDFNQLRELWLADTRINRDHTFVYPNNRGFAGKCLPKDCNAILHSSRQLGYEPAFLAACLKINEGFRKRNQQ